MDKKVSRIIAKHLRALRRVRGSSDSMIHIHEGEFKGAISVLCDLGLIDQSEWWRLQKLASKFSLRAIGVSWAFIKARYVPDSVSTEVVQDEPVSEPVSTSAAPRQLRVFCVLGSGRFQQTENWFGINWRVIEYDGIKVQRSEFPKLGKHWAPSSVLVGNQERKGHSVLRP